MNRNTDALSKMLRSFFSSIFPPLLSIRADSLDAPPRWLLWSRTLKHKSAHWLTFELGVMKNTGCKICNPEVHIFQPIAGQLHTIWWIKLRMWKNWSRRFWTIETFEKQSCHYKPRLVYFLPSFYCGLYCKRVNITGNLCAKQEKSSICGPRIRGL